MNLREVARDTILTDMIKSVSNGWTILVLDHRSTQIVAPVVKMSDLADYGVSLVENLHLKRQPFDDNAAVYFISPLLPSISLLMKDFADRPMYKEIHLFFTSRLSDDLLSLIKNCPNLVARIRTLKEVNLEFASPEPCIFNLNIEDNDEKSSSGDHPLRILMSSSELQIMSYLQGLSRQIASVCMTLKEFPYIRYNAKHSNSKRLANFLQREMETRTSGNRGTLLIVDRLEDCVAPLMHEFTYQAMVYDLLNVQEGNCVEYKAETNSGMVNMTAFLDESDDLWKEFRHSHIADVSSALSQRMEGFLKSKVNQKGQEIADVADAVRELPEYQQALRKLSQHLHWAGQVMHKFTERSLMDVSLTEQAVATGLDENGSKLSRSSMIKMIEKVCQSNASINDKARVLGVYILTQGAFTDSDREKLFSITKMPNDLQHMLLNLSRMDIPKTKQDGGSNKASRNRKKKAHEEKDIAASRFTPKLAETLTKLVGNSLDVSEYPYVVDPTSKEVPRAQKAPMSMRKYVGIFDF